MSESARCEKFSMEVIRQNEQARRPVDASRQCVVARVFLELPATPTLEPKQVLSVTHCTPILAGLAGAVQRVVLPVDVDPLVAAEVAFAALDTMPLGS